MTKRMYLTGTMRTGGSLLINLLSVHSRMVVVNGRLHFFRFAHKRYEPLTPKSVMTMLLEQQARLRHRNNLEMDVEAVFTEIEKSGFNYPSIYTAMMDNFTQGLDKEIVAEFAALSWRNIPAFLRIFPDGKVLHVYRDPRGVLSSWKKLSSIPDNAYLNAIFNWIDSMNHVMEYSETLPPDRYMSIAYESIHADPEKQSRRLCEFADVDFEEELIQPEHWVERIKRNNGLVKIPRSAHEGQNIVGFSLTRTINWQKHLEPWETCLVETLACPLMKQFGYEPFQEAYSPTDFRHGLDLMRANPFLLKQLNVFLSTGQGCPDYPSDPTDPRSWGAPTNPSDWFMDSPVAADYFRDMDNIPGYLEQRFGK